MEEPKNIIEDDEFKEPFYGSERYQRMLEWLVLIGWIIALAFGFTLISL